MEKDIRATADLKATAWLIGQSSNIRTGRTFQANAGGPRDDGLSKHILKLTKNIRY